MMLKKTAMVVGMLVTFGACGTDEPEEGAGGGAGTAGRGTGGTGAAAGGTGGQSELGEGGEAYGPGSHRWELCTEWCNKAAQSGCWDDADTAGAGGEAGATEKPFPDCVELCADDDVFTDARLCPDLYTDYLECTVARPVETFACNGLDANGHQPCFDEYWIYGDCTNSF